MTFLVQLSRNIAMDRGEIGDEGGDPLGDNTDAPAEETNPRYSTAMTLEYNLVKQQLLGTVWDGQSGQTSIVSDFINDWVERRMENGTFGAYPSADQLLADQQFINGAWATRFRAAGAPPTFVYVDDQGTSFFVSTIGEPTITPMNIGYESIAGTAPAGATGVDPTSYLGGQQVQVTGTETATGDNGQFNRVTDSTVTESRTTAIGSADRNAGEGGTARAIDRGRIPTQAEVSGITMNDLDADRRLSNRVTAAAATGLPTLNTGDLQGLLSSGGGGGGGGRTAQEFDLNQLKEATRAVYRRWYRVDPDDRTLDKVAQGYAREANAFWLGKGGRLDFDTYMREKLREDPRYQRMFQFRPPSVDEDRFIAEYEGAIGGLGLRSSTTEAEIRNAAMSGASASSQALRVSRSREASNQAGYARRLGSTVQSLGRLG